MYRLYLSEACNSAASSKSANNMITIRDIAHFCAAVAVMTLMGWLAAWAAVHCLDAEAGQVRDGIKDARTATLPVIP